MISLLTLNIWRYYDFDVRLPNIIKAILNKRPDVVLLQEVQIDPSISSFSQVEIIKRGLSEYKYSIHSTIYLKDYQRGKKLDSPIQHGMAILSKYPIVNSFEFFVSKNIDETEPRSILCFDIDRGSGVSKFANIHFANKEDWAKNQLVEFSNFLNSRKEKRIMAGDFNLFNLPQYKMLGGYKLSYDYKPYKSYPKDDGCLDYVAIPDELEFHSVDLVEGDLSDHKGIFVEIVERNQKL